MYNEGIGIYNGFKIPRLQSLAQIKKEEWNIHII